MPAPTAPPPPAPVAHAAVPMTPPAPGASMPTPTGAPAPGPMASAPGAPAPAPGVPAPAPGAPASVPGPHPVAPDAPAPTATPGAPAPSAPAVGGAAVDGVAPGGPALGGSTPDSPASGAPLVTGPATSGQAGGAPAPVGTPSPGAPAAGLPDPDPAATPLPDVVTPPSSPTTPLPSSTTPLPSPTPTTQGTPSPPEAVGDAVRRYDPWGGGSPVEQVGVLRQGEGEGSAGARRGRRFLVVWSLVVALLAAGVGGVVGAYVEREGFGGDVRLPQGGRVPAGRAPDSVAGIASRALPSVVTLHVSGTDQQDTGTGFVLDAQGHILTNNHVVAPAGSGGEISVTFSSGDSVKAAVVGHDSGYDLAVVQVRGMDGLTPLTLGNSDDVRVGDPVVAIGAPFDLANTVTSGIISAKERPITAGGEKGDGSDVSYVDALQTDAAINPGNSGGPLLDSRAQVIGINSAIRSADSGTESGGSQSGSIGLGFAIPVNQAKRVAEELINDGHATHPVIGVTLDMAYTGDGARIDDKSAGGGPAVTRGGPGEQAGLKAGDVITEVDGQPVHTAEELIVKIRAHRPGDSLRLTVRRGGTDQEVTLRLGAAEQN
ncbi:trypsin-like peptidase domain-containing protein [Streptomyces sp. NPDC002589]|uniref:trypsin-like peptidase domain-containing protein n=1 Tax=Streptomyces sp. NPDC002589 TaxID=3154420 RepID=UPI00331E98EC